MQRIYPVVLEARDRAYLRKVMSSEDQPEAWRKAAEILLLHSEGTPVAKIAKQVGVSDFVVRNRVRQYNEREPGSQIQEYLEDIGRGTGPKRLSVKQQLFLIQNHRHGEPVAAYKERLTTLAPEAGFPELANLCVPLLGKVLTFRY